MDNFYKKIQKKGWKKDNLGLRTKLKIDIENEIKEIQSPIVDPIPIKKKKKSKKDKPYKIFGYRKESWWGIKEGWREWGKGWAKLEDRDHEFEKLVRHHYSLYDEWVTTDTEEEAQALLKTNP